MKAKILISFRLLVAVAFLFEIPSCQKDAASSSANSLNQSNLVASAIDPSLVAWYKFNGDTKDYSGYHNDVIFSNAKSVRGRNGKDNNAYYFNGYSSYMEVKNSPSLNPAKAVTLVAVVYPTGFYQGECHYNRIMQKSFDDFTNGRMELAFSDQPYYNYEGCDAEVSADHETFYGSYGNSSNATGASATAYYIKPDRWYSLIYTFDGTISNLYIDGVLRATSDQPTTYTPNTDDLLIGKTLNPDFPYWFTGVIDAIRIYNRALTTQDVQNLNKVLSSE
ncbi:MAG: LamG domain-containing protein [Parafilimonas sp.]